MKHPHNALKCRKEQAMNWTCICGWMAGEVVWPVGALCGWGAALAGATTDRPGMHLVLVLFGAACGIFCQFRMAMETGAP